MINLTYDLIIERFVKYAQEEENIRAAIIVGSRARRVKPADKWSDLDLVIFSRNPEYLLFNQEWIHEIGKTYISFLENTAVGGGTERRVLFEGGLDVDFACLSTSIISEVEEQNEAIGVFSKGSKLLIDKDKLLESILEVAISTRPSINLATKEEINNSIHDFWYHAVLTSKKLCRGEILVGKSICDSYMKNLLISIIKIQTKLKRGVEFDTWHGFRFFEEWADSNIIDSFKRLYAHYEEKDVWNALKNTMSIFRESAIDVCETLKIEYPDEANLYANQLVESYYNESKIHK
ncbi:aminoglycoside 6-adenylyltransferase [Salinibacillus kushneri]|uniref:Aminoglycoside 6-adenylyltransferase n=1 Tax=Salinibacillus kushneri TaxID=237682 RepID=A0A1I0F0I2_9BACI|nr:aminoglycoside 6-adenylyltransferase [Salinibacillus kushneri]SET51137.1 aminoglycoside 6-adenylyltransferase [Salinibacillus kushneri]